SIGVPGVQAAKEVPAAAGASARADVNQAGGAGQRGGVAAHFGHAQAPRFLSKPCAPFRLEFQRVEVATARVRITAVARRLLGCGGKQRVPEAAATERAAARGG